MVFLGFHYVVDYFARTLSAGGHAGVKLPPQYCSTVAQSTFAEWGLNPGDCSVCGVFRVKFWLM